MHSNINNNIAGQNGGGVYSNTHIAIWISVVDNNRAVNGGGVYATDRNNVPIFVSIYLNTTVSNNTATQRGGGIFTSGKIEHVYIQDNVRIIDNNAGSHGGGAYITSTLVPTDYNQSHGSNDEKLVFDFAGLYISRNTSGQNGGGLYIGPNIVLAFEGSTISHNNAINGAGMYVAAATKASLQFEVHNVNFNNNGSDTTIRGGAVYFTGGADLAIGFYGNSNMRIANNQARYGGGIWVGADGMAFFGTRTQVYENQARDGGGVFAAPGATVYIQGHEIDWTPSGLTAFNSAILNDNIVFRNNEAQRGGAIFAQGAELTANGGVFYRNTTHLYGGGIHLAGNTTAELTATGFFNNVANRYGGGIFVSQESEFNVESGLFVDNHAVLDGGAIFARHSDFEHPQMLGAGNIYTTYQVIFSGNTTGNGSFLPPEGYYATGIAIPYHGPSQGVLGLEEDPEQLQPLNNYDIGFNELIIPPPTTTPPVVTPPSDDDNDDDYEEEQIQGGGSATTPPTTTTPQTTPPTITTPPNTTTPQATDPPATLPEEETNEPNDEPEEDDNQDPELTDEELANDEELTPPTANTVVRESEFVWIEFDDAGVPLGTWTWNPDEEIWLFDPIVPAAHFEPSQDEERGEPMPLTGLKETHIALLAALITSMSIATISAGLIKKEVSKKEVK